MAGPLEERPDVVPLLSYAFQSLTSSQTRTLTLAIALPGPTDGVHYPLQEGREGGSLPEENSLEVTRN